MKILRVRKNLVGFCGVARQPTYLGCTYGIFMFFLPSPTCNPMAIPLPKCANMWQCSIHIPGLSARNRRTTCPLLGTFTVSLHRGDSMFKPEGGPAFPWSSKGL